MAKMKNKSGAKVSHGEIWDDSALLRSWDEAVEEYNLYHSIHARGENVEEILDRAEKEGVENVVAGMAKLHDSMHVEEEVDNGVAQEEIQEGASRVEDESQAPVDTSRPEVMVPPGGGAPSAPDALLGQVQDPALKNLMMAWYYAGYYTGLYEGRQQDLQSSTVSDQK